MATRPTPLPLSVFIIACDEADRIPYTLQSVQGWVDEIIVIDSGSTDDTVSISQSFGAKVLHREWEGYGPQKVFGETQCRQTWLLNLDADEAVSPQLRDEIMALFADGEPQYSGYHLPIRLVTRFEDTPRPLAPSNDPIRLYRKDKAGFADSTVHDSVIIRSGNAGTLQGDVHHRCFRSLTHMVDKINRYSSMQAEDMFRRNRKPSALRIIAEPFVAFLKAYFLRRYILLGIDGFIESIIYAFGRVLRLAKTREYYYKQAKSASRH